LVEAPGGLAIVDTGWLAEAAWDGLVEGIRETGHDVSDIRAVLVTHFHADHAGLAARVREVSGAWIGMHEVLPAHEYRFSGLPARVRQLQDHHRARLREVLTVVAAMDGCTTNHVAERLTWSRPWDQNRGLVRRAAIGETYAHLVNLERSGLIVNVPGDIDEWRVARRP
jgi:metal-dependent hydrolase (beta-lactamase superfamily II)